MADQLKMGSVVVKLTEVTELPEQAGKLSPAEIIAIAKAPRNVSAYCTVGADRMRKHQELVVLTPDLTPAALEEAGKQADLIDNAIRDVELVLGHLRQANLLLDEKAWDLARKLNKLVVAQGASKPEILAAFEPFLALFRENRKSKSKGKGEA